ncbi:MAG TPA: MarR family transcriptional regulator [Gemmatimonadaceae bacterium]|nr:MarR family transcriptional regulator [Gemmatimonadaceae bacterium]
MTNGARGKRASPRGRGHAAPRRDAGTAGDAAGALATADRLHSAAIRLLRLLRREDDATGITAPRLSVLSVLVFAGPRTLGELAAAEQVRPPTMTRLVQALEDEGLVRREGDPRDRRVVHVHATARGRRLLLDARERRLHALTARLRALSARERTVLDHAATLIEALARDDVREDARAAMRAETHGEPHREGRHKRG